MRRTALVALIAVAACTKPQAQPPAQAKAVHTASARDTAFVRQWCDMPDSVLAGKRPCIDRVQKSALKVF